MSEELERLRDKLSQLDKKENWDEAITAFNDIIRLSNNSEEKVEAYINRGYVYFEKGDYDKAIEDYDTAIELNSDNATAYNDRGNAYRNKGDYDKAIKDYKEAIKLDSKNTNTYCFLGSAYFMEKKYDKAIKAFDKAINLDSKNANAYCFRSSVHNVKMEYDKAIKDCKEAIKLDPKNANAYYFLGSAYVIKKKYDKAIKAFDKAIKLGSGDADAYYSRGLSYYQAGNINKAFDDYVEAGKSDEDLKSILPAIYISSRLVCIFKDSEVPSELKSAYLVLLDTVARVRGILFYSNNKGEVAHYTSLDVLKKLADTDTNNHSFRLYNAAYMNDPEEGRVFFDVMNNSEVMKEHVIDLEEDFYEEDNDQRSPAYIGSFVEIKPDKDKNKDKLFLWRTYGKNDDEETTGACLIFDREQFADSPPLLKMGGMYLSIERSDFSQKPELYKICYKGEIEDKKGLAEQLTALSLVLKVISESFQSYEEKREDLTQLVRELLDSIRFLFKAEHYREEQEVRVIAMSYQVGKEPSSIRRIDTDKTPPRLYLEMPEEVKPSEVILGPQSVGVPGWQLWLAEKGMGKVKRSKIKFRKDF